MFQSSLNLTSRIEGAQKASERLGGHVYGIWPGTDRQMARGTERQAVAEARLGGLRQEEAQKRSPAGKEPER